MMASVWCWFLLLTGGASSVLAAGVVLSSNLVFQGACDASAGAALGSNLVVVANDEDNALRLYRAREGGAPVGVLDVGRFIPLVGKSIETDLEGAAWLGDLIYWIGSHGRNREGKLRPNRAVFFATRVRWQAGQPQLTLEGRVYRSLLGDLLRDRRLTAFRLAQAATRAPKSAHALNIEGLCATPEGTLLVGFRNPIPGGKALIVPLLNPQAVVAGLPAKLGDPILLDLGGMGIRDLAWHGGQCYILAGPYDSEKQFKLFTWHGGTARPEQMEIIFPNGFTPEAIVFHGPADEFQVLSDDGTLKIRGVDCKKSPPQLQRFGAFWATLPKPGP